MCGIAGIVNLDGRPVDEALLGRMNRVMRYRGPDDSGVWVEGNAGVASQRLAIIDLSPAGHQPMTNENESLWLVFNGEIYNYRELREELRGLGHQFRSQADSEVILHAYEAFGDRCVERFNGMFAIAIWDRARRRLWLARDRLGVKPLYYVFDGQTFAFASEIKALREGEGVGRKANPRAIAQYLHFSYSLDEETWFEGVRKLMPGWTASLSVASGLSLRKYWDPIDRYRTPDATPGYADRIRELLHDSIRLRLRSDVPLGAHLSGGLDSSSVVALMSQQLEVPVHTFSGAFREGGEYDEREFIHQVVRRFNTRHHETEPRAEQLPELLGRLVWHMDEPAAGPGLFPQYFVCRLTAENGVRVINGGQGGDELFGGYPKYLQQYARLLVSNGGTGHLAGLSHLLGQSPMMVRQLWSVGRVQAVFGNYYTGRNGIYDDAFKARLDGYHPCLPEVLEDRLADELYYDLRYYLPALLQVEDRTSMAVSIESRTPFLDYRLVELGAGIPAAQKLHGGELKHQLRLAMRDLLPASVINRHTKRGFPTPVKLWFRGPLAGWVREVILNPDFLQKRVLSRRYLEMLLGIQDRGLLDVSGRLWAALNLATWFEQFDARPTW